MRGKRYFVIIALVAVFLVVLNLPDTVTRPLRTSAREVLSPYQAGITHFLQEIGSFFKTIKNSREWAATCYRQEGEIALLKREIRLLEVMGRENADLRRLLDFSRRSRDPLIAAEVIAREDSGGWWQTIRLNKGSGNGIQEDQAVIAVEGLVGRTVAVTPNTCDVLLISDRNSKVSIRIAATGTFGILRGGGMSPRGFPQLDLLHPLMPMVVDYLHKDVVLTVGDEVLTAGLGGVFPPDIPVGTVHRVYPDSSGLYQHAEVVPAADLSRLRWVFIVKRKSVPLKPSAKSDASMEGAVTE